MSTSVPHLHFMALFQWIKNLFHFLSIIAHEQSLRNSLSEQSYGKQGDQIKQKPIPTHENET